MLFLSLVLVSLLAIPSRSQFTPVNSTTCNGQQYSYQQLAGYGYVPSDAYDKYFDTIGGVGSSIAIRSWKRTAKGYSGVLYALPDRGWNTQGTLNYQARVHKFRLDYTPMPNATTANPSGPNLEITYLDTILFFAPDGKTPTTGLDGDPTGHLSYSNFPDLPIATYTGDGFGGAGAGGKRIPQDSEGLVVLGDNSFWVSDEYGPYIYHFGPKGKMLKAIRPPDAFIPMRNGTESFSADSPTVYSGLSDDVTPEDPDTGRDNNHGFEGLTASSDGKYLYTLIQAALVQEGGLSSTTERYARLLQYDISQSTPSLVAEYVVPLPIFYNGKKNRVAAQSEIHYVSSTQFLILARDSGNGHGQSSSQSLYRHADIFDISNATNIMGPTYDCANCSIADLNGVLAAGITPAVYCQFLDYNVNSELNKFGVHNGGAQDNGLLNEKWESLALVPLQAPNYILFSMSDNDFITQNGHLNGGKYNYSDPTGFDLDNQLLAFEVTLPTGSAPS